MGKGPSGDPDPHTATFRVRDVLGFPYDPRLGRPPTGKDPDPGPETGKEDDDVQTVLDVPFVPTDLFDRVNPGFPCYRDNLLDLVSLCDPVHHSLTHS